MPYHRSTVGDLEWMLCSGNPRPFLLPRRLGSLLPRRGGVSYFPRVSASNIPGTAAEAMSGNIHPQLYRPIATSVFNYILVVASRTTPFIGEAQ